MTLQQIYYALTIAEIGSMNKAAEKLYITQPALTDAIQELESEIKIAIFNRTNKGMDVTTDGEEFLLNARQVYEQYQILTDRYKNGKQKIRFGVSMQHYSFAVEAFINTVKKLGTVNYDFAVRETKTYDVIEDVGCAKSEIGVLFMNSYNRKIIKKMLDRNELEFHNIAKCSAYVFLWKNHPLAKKKSITFAELEKYPCLSFEQNPNGSMFLAEEILSEKQYDRTIKANDRATMLELMKGTLGYTLCSGVTSSEYGNKEYVVVPFESDKTSPNAIMEIGYIIKRHGTLSAAGKAYIDELTAYFNETSS